LYGFGVSMEIINKTELDSRRIEAMFLKASAGWQAPSIKVVVRYSRGAVYSGTFASHPLRFYVNISRTNRYPLRVETGIAKSKSCGQTWWKPSYFIRTENAYQLALFVFLHEFYHYLIHRSQRNGHRKEGMCDRFAVRYLNQRCRLTVYDANGRPVPKAMWLFQDLDEFVRNHKTELLPSRAASRPPKRKN